MGEPTEIANAIPDWLVDDDNFNESLFIHDIARLMRLHFDRRAQTLGLTRSQWLALAMLRRNPGIKQAGLAELLEVEPITLARLVDALEQSGMVERRADPADRRIKRLYLTSRVQSIVSEMRSLALELRARAMQSVSREEHAAFVTVLRRIKSNLNTREESAKRKNET